jgi:hypothetical protein
VTKTEQKDCDPLFKIITNASYKLQKNKTLKKEERYYK